MAIYYNTETNEYPRHDGDLELLGWSVGTPLPENWVDIYQTDPPAVLENEIAYEVLPQLIGGNWIQQWAVRDMSPEEIELRDNPPQDSSRNPL